MTEPVQAATEGMTNSDAIIAGRTEFQSFMSDPTRRYPDRVYGGTTGNLAADALVCRTLLHAKASENPLARLQQAARDLMYLPEPKRSHRLALDRLCDLLAADDDFERDVL